MLDQLDQKAKTGAQSGPLTARIGAQVNLYEAKTQLSSLVERAAAGEEIVIAKAGKPMARLVPIAVEPPAPQPRREIGQNLLGITILSDDWDAPLSEEELKDWGF